MYKDYKQRPIQPKLNDKMRGDGDERSYISIQDSSSSTDDYVGVIYRGG